MVTELLCSLASCWLCPIKAKRNKHCISEFVMPCSYLHFRYVFILRSRLSLPTRASSRQKGRVWCYELEKALFCQRIFTIHSIYSFNYLHYGKRTGKAIEGRAGRPRQKDERSASSQRNERANGRVQHREHGSGRSAQSPFVRQPNGFGNLFREPSQPIRTPVRPGLKFLSDRNRKTRPSPRLHHPSP